MYVWKNGGKVLYLEFSQLYPIAGFSLYYDHDKGWQYSPETRRIAIQIGPLIVDDIGNILTPEAYALEQLKSDLEDTKREIGDYIGLIPNVSDPNFKDGGKIEETYKYYDAHPLIKLYQSSMDNRLVTVKSLTKFDVEKAKELSCSAITVITTGELYFLFQNWRKEKTCMMWAFRPDYEDIPQKLEDQKKHLQYTARELLTAYQFRIAMPTEEIKMVESDNVETIEIGSKDWYEILADDYPRPWWVAAWSPLEKRGLDKYVAIYREIILSMYKHDPSLVPKPLRMLNKPKYDLSDLIKDWSIDVTNSEKAIETTWDEFHSKIKIDDNEPRKNPIEVIKSGRAHPYDAANTIAEILRQVDRVFGSGWAGGGIPSKSCVLDPHGPTPRAAVKAYVVEEDDWILSEVGKQLGETDKFEQKIEHVLI